MKELIIKNIGSNTIRMVRDNSFTWKRPKDPVSISELGEKVPIMYNVETKKWELISN